MKKCLMKKQYQTIEQFEKREKWNKLSESDVENINENLTDLPWDDDDN